MWKVLVIVIVTAINLLKAEDVDIVECDSVGNKFCDVTKLSVDPCKESPGPCVLKKGKDAVINFDYVPKFNATGAAAMAFYGVAPFAGMDGEACKYTACPLAAGQKNSYKQEFHIEKKFPSGVFTVQWQLWNVENSDEKCCFELSIKLKK